MRFPVLARTISGKRKVAYKTDGGFRNDVIFPGSMILEESSEVKIYYGATDTVECLVTANLDALLALCTEPRL